MREIEHALAEQLDVVSAETLLGAAIDIALAINETVYDALYLALAVELDTVMATADAELIRAASGTAWAGRMRDYRAFVQ